MDRLTDALHTLGIPHGDIEGYRAVWVGSINSAQRNELVELYDGLHVVAGLPIPKVTGWLVDSTGVEWQMATVIRQMVESFTSGEHYDTQNPYTRKYVVAAQCATAALEQQLPEPAIGVPWREIPLRREA